MNQALKKPRNSPPRRLVNVQVMYRVVTPCAIVGDIACTQEIRSEDRIGRRCGHSPGAGNCSFVPSSRNVLCKADCLKEKVAMIFFSLVIINFNKITCISVKKRSI